MATKFNLLILVVVLTCTLKVAVSEDSELIDCNKVEEFTKELRSEIRSKRGIVNQIISLVLNGTEKGSTYNELAFFCDTFGPRLSGSKALEDAIDYMSDKMANESGLKVHREKAMIPKWEVGEQWAEIVQPVRRHMSILALGSSVGTGNKTIEAEVVIAHDFNELRSLGEDGKVEGKIVVFNYQFTSYPVSVEYRTRGALEAAKYKAVAALIRSVTPFSIYSPHAGMGSKSIPTAAITLEDADFIQRWVNRQKKVFVKLYMDTRSYGDIESSNLIGDIEGRERPDEVVLVSGHIDSWYNTDGAMDDGGGMMIAYKALDILSKLNLRARRTVRAILWTSEEFGLFGAQQYFKDHKHELNKFKMVMESDEGTFRPLGLAIKNVGKVGQCVLTEALSMLTSIGTNNLSNRYEGSDIELFTDANVPGASLLNENHKYFYFHHTSGDSITVENPDDLDRALILWAVSSYILADLDVDYSK